VAPLENPQDPLLAPKPPQEDPFPSSPLAPELPIDIERYKIDISDIWAEDDGHDIWGGGNNGDYSDSGSMMSVINIPESPKVIKKALTRLRKSLGALDLKLVTTMIHTTRPGDGTEKGSKIRSWIYKNVNMQSSMQGTDPYKGSSKVNNDIGL